jgi:Fe-S cluster biogenesis protein NfuA
MAKSNRSKLFKIMNQDFQQRIGKIESLISEVEGIADDKTRETVRELVQALLDLHGAGLERLMDIVFESGQAGPAIIEKFGHDPLTSSLLLLHNLHPLNLEERVLQALNQVRPFLGSHGGNVELLGISDDGVVRLRLEGSCHGCPSSQITLKHTIEEAIYAASPDVTAIEVEGVIELQPTSLDGFVPLSSIAHKNGVVAH